MPTADSDTLPVSPIKRFLKPIDRFLHVESAGGLVLLACTLIALALANSPLAGPFERLWKTPVELLVGDFRLAGDLGHLAINDGLMVIFFFVIGLEIKRELVLGELREFRNALLPVVAALGGMVVPAGIYLALQWDKPGQAGWTIPMATDIAFVVGVLSLFGKRVPAALKLFALSLAIVDDLGAVLIIAFVFTAQIAWVWLVVAAGGLLAIHLLIRYGLRNMGVYTFLGVGVWLAVYKSGVHPTVAGVFLGLLAPTTAWVPDKVLAQAAGGVTRHVLDPEVNYADDAARARDLKQLEFAAREAVAPLSRLETALHPWVAFVIMPLFALANAGVVVALGVLGDPTAVAVATSLALGKPLGIVLFCWVAVQLGVTQLPQGVRWGSIVGAACLAGIGFTMALFLTHLAFPAGPEGESPLVTAGKLGTLLGSAISAVAGCLILLAVHQTAGRASESA